MNDSNVAIDQTIKRDELVNQIKDLETIDGSLLNGPLSNQVYQILNRQFENEFKKCVEVVEQYINEAKEEGHSFQKELDREAQIIQYLEILDFFNDHQLLLNAKQRLHSFKGFIARSKTMINEAKTYSELSSQCQAIHDSIQEAYRTKTNYEALVKNLVEIYEKIDKLKKEETIDISQHAMNDLTCSKGSRFIEDIITDIQKDPQQLFKFAYELRRFDKENVYSYQFLNGQVKPHTFVDIIMSNNFHDGEGLMPDPSKFFYILPGNPSSYQKNDRLQYHSDKSDT